MELSSEGSGVDCGQGQAGGGGPQGHQSSPLPHQGETGLASSSSSFGGKVKSGGRVAAVRGLLMGEQFVLDPEGSQTGHTVPVGGDRGGVHGRAVQGGPPGQLQQL